MELIYRDNEGDVRIRISGGTESEVDDLVNHLDYAATVEAQGDKERAWKIRAAAAGMQPEPKPGLMARVSGALLGWLR